MNTRERILKAAEELFYRKGYPLTTIRDIASKAKINSAMINYHFRNKEALYLTIIEKMEKISNSVCLKKATLVKGLAMNDFIKNSLIEICKQYKVFHIYLKEQSQPSTDETDKLVKKIQHDHIEYFCLLFHLQNVQSAHEPSKKEVELLYHSVFGMIKELFRCQKIKLKKTDSLQNALNIKLIISYIEHNYLTRNFLSFFYPKGN